ncbi:hypothetical protein [Dokdonella koreensis]|nr:hypothetical protein [Dokdonella koreensis]
MFNVIDDFAREVLAVSVSAMHVWYPRMGNCANGAASPGDDPKQKPP